MNSTFISVVSGLSDYLLYASIIATILVTIGWIVIRLGNIKAPIYKHMIWFCTLFAVVILPVIWLYAPKVGVKVLPTSIISNMELSQIPAAYTSPSINALPAESHNKLLSLVPVKIILGCLWSIGFLFMLARFLIGWQKIKQIIRSAEPLPVPVDINTGNTFTDRSKLFLSTLIDGPLCLGIFRPVILLPKDLYLNGRPEDLMMILRHELAHIERRDCLVNIFQRIIEAILFFHPFIWYASAQLTHQREILCDHHVISKGVTPIDYIELLTRVIEQGFGMKSHNAVALFEGRKFLSRTKTLLSGNNVQLKSSPIAIVAGIITVFLFMASGTIRLEAKSSGSNQKAEIILSDKDAELLEAIDKDDIAAARAALSNGANVNTIVNRIDMTAIMRASGRGHADIVKLLLEKGANVNAKSIHGYTALTAASRNGHADIVKLLIDSGADVNAKEIEGATALMAASWAGHADVVRLLLDNGADVNAEDTQGRTVLMYASVGNDDNTDVVQLLLDNGADINAKDIKYSTTAIMAASLDGNTNIVKTLVKAGAKEDNNSRLILATRKGDFAGVRKSLSDGANINTKYTDGITALMVASEMGHEDVVKLLLRKGADVNARDIEGRTSLNSAIKRGNTAIEQLIKEAGGIISVDDLVKTILRNAATAQEAYRVDNKTYSDSIDKLEENYGLHIYQDITLQIISADENRFHIIAFYKQGNKKYQIRGPGGRIEESAK